MKRSDMINAVRRRPAQIRAEKALVQATEAQNSALQLQFKRHTAPSLVPTGFVQQGLGALTLDAIRES